MALTVRFLARGVVQGVGYRAFARNAALRLGLAGYARNLPDGSVECVVRGASAAIDQMQSELRKGPRFGRVDELSRSEVSGELDLPIAFATR